MLVVNLLIKKYQVDPYIQTIVSESNFNTNSPCYIYSNIQEGDQPIHIAAARGYPDIVQVLIQEFHVDPTSKAKVAIFVCDYLAYISCHV